MSFTAEANDTITEQRKIRDDHKQTYQLMGGITLVAVGVWLGAQLFGGDAGFTTNVYTEGLSILVTVLVLNWFAERRATRQRKQELFLQLGSQSNDFALEAKGQLEQLGWLDEALERKKFPDAGWQRMNLSGRNLEERWFIHTNFENANLMESNCAHSKFMGAVLDHAVMLNADCHSADLSYAKLRKTGMNFVNLTDAILERADVTGAYLSMANLHRAKLNSADFTDSELALADLTYASLFGTRLRNANLMAATLWHANLVWADFEDALLYEDTTLPDGTFWTPDTDMCRFTDPDHPDFWRSDDPASPAYRGV